jgi:hypothetical protein
MTTIQRTGSIKQNIVSPDLVLERKNCPFDQKELTIMLHGGQLAY